MAHHKLRQDKTCQNCNYVVENKFCPNCGQENSETRQSFHYLFTHFFEDLTHYDGEFWKTIKRLLFKPGELTKEYLSGKRKKSVPPVKLYIFISFVTFLLPNLLPEVSIFGEIKKEKTEVVNLKLNKKDEDNGFLIRENITVKNIEELDSVQKTLPEGKKMNSIEYNTYKAVIKLMKEKNQKELFKKALESFVHTLPKVLFVYMPIFAFLLWLLHDKKKWYYFDSGVFTLHYFSFLLLLITIGFLFNWFVNLIHPVDAISIIFTLSSIAYSFFYFFRAHSNFYGEEKVISRLKSFLLFFVNMILITLISSALFLYSVLTIH